MNETETELVPHLAKGKIPQRIKAQIVAPTTVILENGDIIVVQTVVLNVMRVVGQKDANGLQLYEFQTQQAVGRPEAAIEGATNTIIDRQD